MPSPFLRKARSALTLGLPPEVLRTACSSTGAARVHAIDVGTNQLVWKLRQDPRVIVKEKFNARYMTPEDIGEQVDLIVSDVSFISLKKILPAAFPLLKKGGDALVLIKPQFELQPEDIGPAASSGTRLCTGGRWTPYALSSRRS